MSSQTTETVSPPRYGLVDRLLPLCVGLILLVWIGQTLYRRMTFRPVEVAKIQSRPLQMRSHNGTWYWLESEKGQSRLLSESRIIAKAEAISSYDVNADNIFWAAKEGSRWTIYGARRTSLAGPDAHPLWSGDTEPSGLRCSGANLFWTIVSKESLPKNLPFPALASHLTIYRRSAGDPTQKSEPTVLATLYETAGEVVGADAQNVYFRAEREGSPGSTAFYSLALTGSTRPRRLAGEEGINPALLTPDGTLYWVGASQDSSEVTTASLRRLTKSGTPETVMDWLPAGGDLSYTPRGVCYVNSTGAGSIWPEVRSGELPRSLPLPDGYALLAADEDSVLFRQTGLTVPGIALFRMPLP